MQEFGIDRKAYAGCRAFFQFFFKTGFLIGGRITVMVDPSHEGDRGDRIIASTLWLPPQIRPASWNVPIMIKADIIPLLKGWGLIGWQVRNIPLFYCNNLSKIIKNLGSAQRVFLEYKARLDSKMGSLFKEKEFKMSPDDSWYLQVTFTDPEYQGKGNNFL